MNARSDLDAIAAVQAEEITDPVITELDLDTVVIRTDIKHLPRRTALAFIRMINPGVSSSTEPPRVPEIYCFGYITDLAAGHEQVATCFNASEQFKRRKETRARRV